MNTTTSALYYIEAIIRLTFRYFVFFPATALFILLVVVSEFSFNQFFTEAYGYISKVSQNPAESLLHVNQEVCITKSQPVVSVEGDVLPPPVKCDEWELKSVLIEDIAQKTADTAYRLYVFFVVFFATMDIAFRLMFGRAPWLVNFFDTIFKPIERLFKKSKTTSV